MVIKVTTRDINLRSLIEIPPESRIRLFGFFLDWDQYFQNTKVNRPLCPPPPPLTLQNFGQFNTFCCTLQPQAYLWCLKVCGMCDKMFMQNLSDPYISKLCAFDNISMVQWDMVKYGSTAKYDLVLGFTFMSSTPQYKLCL